MSPATTALLDIERLLAPISSEQPTGRDLKYDPIFDRIRAARSAAMTAENTERSWTDVATVAANALATQSKDLRLAVWLVEAAVRLEGFGAIAEGFTFLERLASTFWTRCFPLIDAEDDEPLGARTSQIEWLNRQVADQARLLPLTDSDRDFALAHYESGQVAESDRRQAYLSDKWPSSDEFEKELDATSLAFLDATRQDVGRALEAVQRCEQVFDNLCAASTPDGAEPPTVSLGNTRKVLETCAWILERARNKRSPTAAAPVQPPAPAKVDPQQPRPDVAVQAVPPPVVEPVPSNANSAALPPTVDSRETAIEQIRRVSTWLREDNSYSPLPYLLSRAVGSGVLTAYASLDEALPLPAPTTTARQRLRTLYTEQNWVELLAESEQAIASAEKQAWLDVYRYSIVALEQLGGRERAVSVARLHLRGLLELFPDLARAELDDGTAAAGRDTQDFLDTLTSRRPPAKPSPLPSPPVAAPPPATSAVAERVDSDDASWEQALALGHSNQLPQAIALLQARIAAATSGRQRFVSKLRVAELCFQFGNPGLAWPIAEELATAIDRDRLDQWEDAALMARVWTVMYRCCRHEEQSDPSVKARSREAFARLCRLDAAGALALEQESTSTAGDGR